MPRLLFEKTGNAVWISHLDLMRVFQRAFKRAGLPLTHTHGYNPRPSVSIALPLSVGVESHCELLDFELEEPVACGEIARRLNDALIEGVHVLDAYENGGKLKDLGLMDCAVKLTYDGGVPENAVTALQELFGRPALTVEKKSKKGVTQQDIIPLIRSISYVQTGEKELVLHVTLCCQEPSLNPMQLVAAIEAYEPRLMPDHAACARDEIYYRSTEPEERLKKFR